jgi:hypothetical protein
VLGDQVLAVGRDRVDVLQHLEALEVIVAVKPHARADDLEQVHDPERIVALMCAQLAMVGVIDRDQRIDAGALGGIELVLLQFPSIRRQRTEIVAHHADRGLLEVDQFDARHGMEDVLGGLDHALEPGMAVQGDAHRNRFAQKRPEPVEIAAQEEHERSHLERLEPRVFSTVGNVVSVR